MSVSLTVQKNTIFSSTLRSHRDKKNFTENVRKESTPHKTFPYVRRDALQQTSYCPLQNC